MTGTTATTNISTHRTARPPARILLVTHGYPPHQTGGAELQALRKARWWAARGDEVRVFAADTSPDTAPPFGVLERCEDRDGQVSVSRLRFRAPDGTRSFEETFQNQLLAPEIEREIASFRPDIVYHVSGYLFGVLPLALASRQAIPTVLFAMDFWHTCPRITLLRADGTVCPGPRHPADCAACRLTDRPRLQRHPAIARVAWRAASAAGNLPKVDQRLDVSIFSERQLLVRSMLGSVSLVVVNSHFLASQLRQLGVPEHRLLIVRQGLDLDEAPRVPRVRSTDDPLRVLYLGQIAHHKGVDLAIRAVRDLAGEGYRIHLRIHGQPTGSAAYRADLAVLGASPAIEIGTPLDRHALMQALRDSDVLVVPSRWYENSPNVILEAFAAGVPAVVANHGGMAEMVRDGVDGLHFQPGDITSLTHALQRLCDEPKLVDHLCAGVIPPTSVDVEMGIEEAALARLFSHRK